MRVISQLNEEELISYSRVLITLTKMLLSDKDFAVKFMYGYEGKRFLRFPCDYAGIMQFDREKRQLSYHDILMPNGILDDIIEYGF